MKTGLHIFLAVLFLYQTCSTTLLLLNFELNRVEIARTFCVKRAEKKNCCQGSCHLKKQLQAEDKRGQSPANTLKLLKQIPLICQTNSFPGFQPTGFAEKIFTPFQTSGSSSFSPAIFHPPCSGTFLTV